MRRRRTTTPSSTYRAPRRLAFDRSVEGAANSFTAAAVDGFERLSAPAAQWLWSTTPPDAPPHGCWHALVASRCADMLDRCGYEARVTARMASTASVAFHFDLRRR